MNDDTMLAEAIEEIKLLGGEVQKVIEDKLQARGKTHAIIAVEQEQFSLRAKEYRYKGKSSFGLEQVEEADEQGYTLLSYIDKLDSFFVFDAAYVLENDSKYTQPSKKSKERVWIEVEKSAGVDFTSYRHGDVTPSTLAGENATLASF